MRSVLAGLGGLLVLSGMLPVQSAAQAGAAVPLAPFRSVELRNGGRVILRAGAPQRVTFLRGSAEHTQITITAGGALVIEKCPRKCARGYELEVEIVTPELARLTVAQGGTIQSRGNFPHQAEIDVTVDNGGTIDARSMSVGSVTASVVSGGRILVRPVTAMVARVVAGGNITYWGDAPVTQSIEHGGIIAKGTASDAAKPLSEAGDAIAPLPPVPAPPSIERR